MILEGIVTTLDVHGRLNVAPMGPEVENGLARFTLRPYRTSTTYQNLKASGDGVLHVTDDVLLLARSAISKDVDVKTRPALHVRGSIIETTGRYVEFRVVDLDDSSDRTTILAEAVFEGRQAKGDFFGLNRGKHAVVEAAILATRLRFLPIEQIQADMNRLAILVEKTGGEDERRAFGLLLDHVVESQ